MKNFVIKHKRHLIFFAAYTVAFIIVRLFVLYLLPFIIGTIVSLIMYPVYSFMKKRLSFKPAFSATVITLFIFSIIIALISFVVYLLVFEAINLYNNNIEFFSSIFSEIDLPNTFKDIEISGDMFSKISDTAFSIVRVVPISITLIIISFVSTVCIINNLSNIKTFIMSKLRTSSTEHFQYVLDNTRSIFSKFVRSYLLLYSLTFVESLFVFYLIDLDYKLVFAFLTAVSDLLPILGPGTVYIPIAIIKIISGEYLSAITLIIFWGIVIVIRQIIEPKILSDTIKIHPLVILSGLYFSIISSNIWVLFYITILSVIYKILVESYVLKPLFNVNKQSSIKES